MLRVPASSTAKGGHGGQLASQSAVRWYQLAVGKRYLVNNIALNLIVPLSSDPRRLGAASVGDCWSS